MYQAQFSTSAMEMARGLLKGTYDLHMHSGPSLFPRRADDRKTLAEADAAGMAGIGLKAHEGDTAIRADLLNSCSSGCKVYGGIALNHYVGGLNPAAVEATLKLGGKIVWLPTLSSRQHIEFYARQGLKFLGGQFRHGAGAGVAVLTENGDLVPAMGDVFKLVESYGSVLSTGHISSGEALKVARGFRDGKVGGRLVMGHPDLIINQATMEEQQEFARLGGFVDKCTLALHEAWGHIPIEEFTAGIRRIGTERCFLSTDAGGPDRGSSPDTCCRFIAMVLERKLLTEQELRILMVDVPRLLIGE